jgi:hypothetical protein
MPNHVTNQISITGGTNQIQQCLKEFGTHTPSVHEECYSGNLIYRKDDEKHSCGWYDVKAKKFMVRDDNDFKYFDDIPDGYSPQMSKEYFAFPDFPKVIPPPNTPAYRDEPTQQEAQNSPDWWYNWNCANWGTKWGGYEYETKSDNVYQFDTAWSAALPITLAMSKAYPELQFEHKWADEDTGNNAGIAYACGGGINVNEFQGGSKQAYDLAFELKPDDKQYYKWDGTEYVGVEE